MLGKYQKFIYLQKILDIKILKKFNFNFADKLLMELSHIHLTRQKRSEVS